MEPFLLDGDQLTVEPVAWGALRTGDIVTCRLDDRFPTMRIVRKLPTKLTLRGDGWPALDFEAWPDDVLGKVVARRRGDDTLTGDDWRWSLGARMVLADDRSRRLKRRTEAVLRRISGAVQRRAERWLLGRNVPIGVHVNISANCNLSCRMCPYLPVHDDSGYTRNMTEETFRGLLPSLVHIKRLHFAGAGEPLMNRDLLTFIDLAREVNPRIDITITTNGTLLTDAFARGLIERRVNRLTVSLDGFSHETVSSIRVGINTPKVISNIEMLDRLKRELHSAFPALQLNYVIGYGNYSELPDFIRRAPGLGAKDVMVLEVFAGTEESVRNDLRHSLDTDGGATLRLAKRLADHAGIRLILPVTSHTACFHPSTPHIAENGDVSPCCFVDYEGRSFFIDGREVQMPKIEFGNLRDGFAAAWQSSAYRELRSRNARGDLPPSCRSCLSARAPTSIRVQQVLG